MVGATTLASTLAVTGAFSGDDGAIVSDGSGNLGLTSVATEYVALQAVSVAPSGAGRTSTTTTTQHRCVRLLRQRHLWLSVSMGLGISAQTTSRLGSSSELGQRPDRHGIGIHGGDGERGSCE